MWWLLGLVGVWWWEQRSSQGSGPTVTNAPSMAGMHFVPVDNNSHPIPGQVDPRYGDSLGNIHGPASLSLNASGVIGVGRSTTYVPSPWSTGGTIHVPPGWALVPVQPGHPAFAPYGGGDEQGYYAAVQEVGP